MIQAWRNQSGQYVKGVPNLSTSEANRKRKGMPLSPEHRKNLSKALKGRVFSPEHRTRLSASLRKNRRRYDRKGYVIIGKLREHRIVMEGLLGRKLERWEEIHHINGIKDDNRPENLSIMVRGFHKATLRCPHCLKNFNIA